MPPRTALVHVARAAPLIALLAACDAPRSAVEALPPTPDAQTATVAALRDGMTDPPLSDAADSLIATELRGTGFAQVAGQPGGTLNQRRLMAIRAARLSAMRDLAEQVHGLRLSSQSTVSQNVLRDDVLRGLVEGEIRGARTLRITPRDADSFEVVMALSPDTVRYILRAAGRGA